MSDLSLAMARTILDAALAHARAERLKALAVVVLDARGAVRAAASEDGASLHRMEIAHGKAYGALGLGVGSRTVMKMALDRPHFIQAYVASTGGRAIPVPGGVLVRSEDGDLIGAVGISGDTSDADEAAALAGIQAAGLVSDPGAA